MNADDYQRATEIFAQACDLPKSARAAFLDQACRDCPHLRKQVEAMLASDQDDGLQAGGAADWLHVLDQPPPAIGPTLSADAVTPGTTPVEMAGFAGYEILEEIGRGGMGVVFRARQQKPHRTVALKMIRAGKFASREDLQRFQTEAEAAANLDHDGIVPVYEVGEHEGEHYFSMKFVEGRGLDQLLNEGNLDQRVAVELLRDVADAVAHAHLRGVVHRDLKPSNILVDGQGRPRVTDFGLAKYLHRDSTLTAAGEIMGTPGYMSPEQATGAADTVTLAADVYSLGAILYEILAGRPPIEADPEDLAATLQRMQEQEIDSPRSRNRRVPRDLDTICMKCLERNPADRYESARELCDDLDRYLEDEAILAKPLSTRRRLLRWSRQRPGLAATWAALAVFLLYHLLIVYAIQHPDITQAFHIASLVVIGTWAIGAWCFQRLLIRTDGRSRYLYPWVTMDVVLLTVLLFFTDGPRSPLMLLYLVLVAGAVLRFRTDIVGYVTVLAAAGYGLHVTYAALFHPDNAVGFLEFMPFMLSLIVIGVVQYFALRRTRASYELVAHARRESRR